MQTIIPNCWRMCQKTNWHKGAPPAPNHHLDYIQQAGDEASRSKHFTQTLTFFLIMTFQFQSSAIENISDVQNEQVTITFNGGRDYTYTVADPASFVSDLQLVIENEDSVGKFINLAIRSEALTQVIAA